MASIAEGVVVGSALVELVGEYGNAVPAKLRELTSALAQAVRTAR